MQIEKLKAVQLHIIAAYHLTAFQLSLPGGSSDDETTRWSAGKIKAQNFLQMVFGMPEVVLAVGREGTRVGHFRKEARQQLIAACVTLSEFVYGLEPLAMNRAHPTPPARLEVAIKSMVADGATGSLLRTADRTSFNLSHALYLVGAAPLKAPGGLKEGHSAPVTCVQTHGRLVVSAGDDGGLALWDLASGTCVRTLLGHGDSVTALALFEAPTGGLRAVSASRDETLKIWALGGSADADGCLRTYTTCHAGGVTCVAVLPGGFRAVSGGADGALRMWSLSGGATALCVFGGAHVGGVLCVAVFDAQGGAAMAVSGGADGALKVWSLAAAATSPCDEGAHPAEPHAKLRGHGSAVNCVHVLVRADGSTCALSGDAAGGLKLWQLAAGGCGGKDAPRCLRNLEGCLGGVWACGAFAGGTMALSVSDDTCLRLWDLETGACQHAVPGHPHREYCSAINEEEGSSRAFAVTGGDDAGQLKVWHLPCPPAAAVALHPTSIPSLLLALSPKPKARRASKAPVADDAGFEWEESELALNLGACFEE